MVRPLRPEAFLVAILLSSTARADPCPPGMHSVAGGAYRMANGDDASVGSFCMDVTEVTVAAYGRCVDAGACHAEDLACGKAATWGKPGTQQHPVNCVTWFEADTFCRAHGKRLPTEPEWEWAARGGRRATSYPWGEAPPANRACWDGDGNTAGKGDRTGPCRVATHPRSTSRDGLQDLAGNVREWTATTEEGRFRVLRGGSWGDSLPEFLSAGFRGWNAPDERLELTGFRCASEVGARTWMPRRQVAKAPAVTVRDDGFIVMPEVNPARHR
jgi:formylglycine-generating enzyme required for sulfatase activity